MIDTAQFSLPLEQLPALLGNSSAHDLASALLINAGLTHTPPDGELIRSLPAEKWLLASQLQKAIRRGKVAVASATASALCRIDPAYVLRRLPVIAYEDIGVANAPLIALVKHTTGRLLASPLGNTSELAGGLASLLASSPKSRTACDILSFVAASDTSAFITRELSGFRAEELAALAKDGNALLIERAIAFRLLIAGRVVGSKAREERLAALSLVSTTMKVPDDVLRAAVAGHATHDLNCYLPLAYESVFLGGSYGIRRPAPSKIRTECFGPVLQCALDMYTRVGQSAYRSLIGDAPELRDLLQLHLRSSNRVKAVGMLLFHAEGSILDRAVVSAASAALLEDVEQMEARQCGFATDAGARAVRRWLRRNSDKLAAARRQALASIGVNSEREEALAIAQ